MIVLSDKIVVTSTYSGKSKFNFWHELELKDILTIALPLKPTGQSKGRIYAPDITITNNRTGEKYIDTINSIQNYLNKIEFEEL